MGPDHRGSKGEGGFPGDGGLLPQHGVAAKRQHVIVAPRTVQVDVEAGMTQHPLQQGLGQALAEAAVGAARKHPGHVAGVDGIASDAEPESRQGDDGHGHERAFQPVGIQGLIGPVDGFHPLVFVAMHPGRHHQRGSVLAASGHQHGHRQRLSIEPQGHLGGNAVLRAKSAGGQKALPGQVSKTLGQVHRKGTDLLGFPADGIDVEFGWTAHWTLSPVGPGSPQPAGPPRRRESFTPRRRPAGPASRTG